MSHKYAANRPLTDEEEAEIQAMIASDNDAAEATDEALRQAQPFRAAHPQIAERMDRELSAQRQTKAAQVKELVSLRLDREVLEVYRAKGKGWQTRMNNALRKAAGL